MNIRLGLLLSIALVLYGCGEEEQTTANSPGFAGLGQTAEGFQHVQPAPQINSGWRTWRSRKATSIRLLSASCAVTLKPH